ncbi:IS3 family transposase [Ureibacillus thermosphaericus]|uniref:IS3 family transposase n=1 Tax=Ureibacillus thermosphaericus TaxID=51173 RepID=UPI001558CBC1
MWKTLPTEYFVLLGAPKIYEILKKEGYIGSINRVQRLMKQAGIKSCIVKKYRPTPTSKPQRKLCWKHFRMRFKTKA